MDTKVRGFEYFEPKTVDEAAEVLASRGEDAKVLAGGQALLPMMSARLVNPRFLVGLSAVPELKRIDWDDQQGLRLGAMVTQRTIEHSALIREKCPVLADTASRIASSHVRNMGTIGGNLAHNLVGSDPPATLIALGAEIGASSTRGKRTIPASEFFTGFMETVLQPDELLTGVRIPPLAPGGAVVYLKHTVRAVDPALVGIALLAVRNAHSGSWSEVRIGVSGVSEAPLRLRSAEDVLRGRQPDDATIKEAAKLAMDEVDPMTDAHGSASYRRKMTGVILGRAVRQLLMRFQMKVP